jgi:hypothetical protein
MKALPYKLEPLAEFVLWVPPLQNAVTGDVSNNSIQPTLTSGAADSKRSHHGKS